MIKSRHDARNVEIARIVRIYRIPRAHTRTHRLLGDRLIDITFSLNRQDYTQVEYIRIAVSAVLGN